MEVLLARLGAQAMNMALRSGLAVTSTYAIGQCSRLLKTVDNRNLRAELKTLQDQLNTKINILSPVIDLIEFKSGRGNIFLESAVPLAKSLHRDIVSLGHRLEHAALAEEDSRRLGTAATTAATHHAELVEIIHGIKALLARIEREIPTLQLAITASGETLSSSLPAGISPSRFLQASFFLNMADTQFAHDPSRPVQIGPVFSLSLYMLFVGHASNPSSHPSGAGATDANHRPATPDPSRNGTPLRNEPYGFGEGERRPIWQEVLHKARVRLCRTPLGWYFDHSHGYVPPTGPDSSPLLPVGGRPDEFSYHLEIVEDLNDGRVHEDDTKSRPYSDIDRAGIRESIPIHQVAKIFYTDSGRILNIGNADEAGNNPVLLLKRDSSAPTPVELTDALLSPPGAAMAAGAIEDANDSVTSDEQDEIDRQLREESEAPLLSAAEEMPQHPLALHLPAHLDPEWLALEVFQEDDDVDDTDSEDAAAAPIDDDEFTAIQSGISKPQLTSSSPPNNNNPRSPSLDANLLTQIKTLALRSSADLVTTPSRHSSSSPPAPPPPASALKRHVQQETPPPTTANPSRASPFGTITSSLSLMEMLIRLTSLQEFQQAAHLSIPDYILSFFLDETSTTGLKGEERWRARDEAKRRVGFDPYTDTPSK